MTYFKAINNLDSNIIKTIEGQKFHSSPVEFLNLFISEYSSKIKQLCLVWILGTHPQSQENVLMIDSEISTVNERWKKICEIEKKFET